MAYQKLIGQIQRSLTIIPSDEYDIPFPGNRKTPSGPGPQHRTEGIYASDASGITTELEDSNADFVAWGVEIGDIVYARRNPLTPHDPFVTEVTTIMNKTTLTVKNVLGTDFSAAGTPYEIYSPETYPCQVMYKSDGTIAPPVNATVYSQDDVKIDIANIPTPIRRLLDVPIKKITAGGTTDGTANENFIGQW